MAEPLWIPGPDGRLDARLHGPPGGAPVLLLAPHPQMGGTMGSRLVHRLATRLADSGFRALRFDYRGVGRSEGSYGHGLGECEDATVAFDHLSGLGGRGPSPIVVGYSFGGAVACRLATMRTPARLVAIAPPLDVHLSHLRPMEDAPNVRSATTVFVGDQDPFVPVPDAERLARAFRPPADLVVLPAAGHLLEPSEAESAVAAVAALLSSAP